MDKRVAKKLIECKNMNDGSLSLKGICRKVFSDQSEAMSYYLILVICWDDLLKVAKETLDVPSN